MVGLRYPVRLKEPDYLAQILRLRENSRKKQTRRKNSFFHEPSLK